MKPRQLVLAIAAVGALVIAVGVSLFMSRRATSDTSPTQSVTSRTSITTGPMTTSPSPTAPDVATAAREYIACMKARGFAVSTDLFTAPRDVMQAEHSTSTAAQRLVADYDAAWRICSGPYQRAIDGQP